jgi:toxin ParE1/3/4
VTPKPVVLRRLAQDDVEEIVDYYAAEAGEIVAAGFVSALEQAFAIMRERPATGSPRFSHELGLPGLRSRKLAGYPFAIFYIERNDGLDVWRVLHLRRDIPLHLRDFDE